ncbi:MAG: hypothetical protein H6980_12335 [Gammaproteobacteria bacterium]|nr:hypothetical protein [Gammaproteobacteria bacterium]
MSKRDLKIAVRFSPDCAWADDFFPPDMPESWRPVYLGNELRCALTSAAYLADVDAEELAAWREAIEAGLTLLFDDDPDLLPAALHEAGAQRMTWDEHSWEETFAQIGETIDDATVVVLIDAEAAPDPKQTREWIETALEYEGSAHIVIVFDGPAAMQAAKQAQTVSGFMDW